MERPVRGGLRADAVCLFTLARSVIRSIWKTPDHSALKSRSRIGLHRDGDGAHVELAFPRPNYFRNHDFKYSHRDGLHRRRYAKRKTSWSVRPDWRGIRRRVHVRTSNWWIGGRRQSASRVLDCSRFSLANWLWGYFFVPESLAPNQRKEFKLRRANPVGSLTLLRSHHELWRLTTIQFLAYVSHNVFSVWALYAIYRYNWSQGMIGISLMVVGIVTALVSGGLTGRMVTRFGEKRTLYIGQFFGASGMVIAGLAKTGAWLLASIPIISLWNISMPAAQSMMTHRVSEREQGELQGALQSMRSITFIIGPWLFLRIFGWFIDAKNKIHLPGAPYYLAAALLFTAMLMSTRIKRGRVESETAMPQNIPLAPPEVTATGAAPFGEAKENI